MNPYGVPVVLPAEQWAVSTQRRGKVGVATCPGLDKRRPVHSEWKKPSPKKFLPWEEGVLMCPETCDESRLVTVVSQPDLLATGGNLCLGHLGVLAAGCRADPSL